MPLTDAQIKETRGWLPESWLVRPDTHDPAIIEGSGLGWAKTLYPSLFNRPSAKYQEEFWDWGWQIESDTYYRPRVECEPRGVGKSTNGEVLVTALVARKKRKMIGYVSLEEDKAGKHFDSIKALLENEELLKYYPHCRPKVQKLNTKAQQWSRDALVTDSGAMIVPLSMQGSSRGWKSSLGLRFDMIVLDDMDKLGMSADLIKKLLGMLKGEILAAGDDNTLVLVLQNLIHRDSIVTQILDHRADILSDRIFCGPYPLLKWYDAEKVDYQGDDTGAKKWTITAGEAYDPAISIEYAEKLLNKFGKVTFDRECQQRVFDVEDDKDFREWSEPHHLITHSEFRTVMESMGEPVWNEARQRLQIPWRWNVGIGLDSGTTPGHPSAAAFVARPSEASPLKNCHFVFAEVILPKFPRDAYEVAEQVSPGRVSVAIQDCLHLWNIVETQIQMKLMSHEASSALLTMAVDLKEEIRQYFQKWKAQKGSGVPQIQNLLEIDYTKPHPFRRYPEGYKISQIDVSGQPLKGCPRIFFIVADGQGELQVDLNGSLYTRGAKDDKGLARARFEIPLYSQYNQGGKKIDDDWTDGFRGLMARFGVTVSDFTREENIEHALEEKHLSVATIEAIPTQDERDLAYTHRLIQQKKIIQQMDAPVRSAAANRLGRR